MSYIGITELAKRLGVSQVTARKYVKDGLVRSTFMGGRYRVEEEDYEEFVRSRQRGPKGRAATYSAYREDVRGEDAYPDPYSALSEVVENFAERWERRIESGDFELGSYKEFVSTLTQDIGPTLRRLNEQEVRHLPPQPYSGGVPAASTGRATNRLLELLNPVIAAMHSKMQESELAQFRRELESQVSGARRDREAG